MAINFPTSPSVGDIYTYNGYIWEYVTGGYWKSVAEQDYIYSASSVGSGTSVISGITGGNLYLKSFSGNGITISDSNGVLTFSASTGGGSFTGGTVTGATSFTGGLTANTFSSTTYQNLPVSAITSGTGISASTSNGNVTITNTSPDKTVTISGGTGITTGGTYPNFTLVNSSPDQTVTITGGTNIQIAGAYPNFGVNFTGTTGGASLGTVYTTGNNLNFI